MLQSKDFHALWVSHHVLELSVLLSQCWVLDNAPELLNIPKLMEGALVQRFSAAMNNALAYGLTSVNDAGLDPTSLEFFIWPILTGKLSADDPGPTSAYNLGLSTDMPQIRIYTMRFFNETMPYWGNTTSLISSASNNACLTARNAKIFADGALRTGGSALYKLYTENPTTSGFMRLAPGVRFDFTWRFHRDRRQIGKTGCCDTNLLLIYNPC
ncbi:hypothetical protein B0H14DRAFT_3464950 [Mycena olivaceomarginata]|nr:hypothetical protein B0H14DRAFT_3464950 [Mycena olivaceomarginata]